MDNKDDPHRFSVFTTSRNIGHLVVLQARVCAMEQGIPRGATVGRSILDYRRSHCLNLRTPCHKGTYVYWYRYESRRRG